MLVVTISNLSRTLGYVNEHRHSLKVFNGLHRFQQKQIQFQCIYKRFLWNRVKMQKWMKKEIFQFIQYMRFKKNNNYYNSSFPIKYHEQNFGSNFGRIFYLSEKTKIYFYDCG